MYQYNNSSFAVAGSNLIIGGTTINDTTPSGTNHTLGTRSGGRLATPQRSFASVDRDDG